MRSAVHCNVPRAPLSASGWAWAGSASARAARVARIPARGTFIQKRRSTPHSKSIAFEKRLVDFVLRDLFGDAAAGQAADLGAAADVSAAFLECPLQIAFLETGGQLGELLRERPGQIDLHGNARLDPIANLRRKGLGPDRVVAARDTGPLGCIFELADIARPVERQEHVHGLGGDSRRCLAGRTVLLCEV